MSVEDIGALDAAPAPPPAPPRDASVPLRDERVPVRSATVPLPNASVPVRNATVPVEAVWNLRTLEWEVAPVDGAGRRVGLARAWRPDGTLASETLYRDDERDGAFKRFHPDGTVAREGLYVRGQFHGLIVSHGLAGPTPEPLQMCCVPAGAMLLEHDYEQGRLLDTRWFDGAGVLLLPSGAPHPARPAAVPPEARFEERRDQWVQSSYSPAGQREGVWRRWARQGVLRERDEYHDGKAHGLWQRFDAAGALMEEDNRRDGQRTGVYRRVGVPADLYTDARVHEERGAFERDQTVGPWTLLDDAGAVVCARALGAALDDAALLASPALVDPGPSSPATAAAWLELSDALARQGRPGEALLAAARATAEARDAGPLRASLARLALPLREESARGSAAALVKRADGKLALVVNGLPAGADAATLLRSLASSLVGRDLVALALVDAALLLAPDRAECHVTRALVNVHLGHAEAARQDIAALPADWTEQRAFLDGYAHVIFSTYAFAPTLTEIRTQLADVPDGPEQPLASLVAQIRKYATRLGVLRAAVRARLPKDTCPPWLPPDLTALLPDGPVALDAWEFEEIVEDEDAPEDAPPAEPTLVKVDETLTFDAATPLPSLLRLARREWAGVSWLCWSVGLDRVALPTTIAPPPAFGIAAGMAIERLWRCRDRIITRGLRAMTQGVPGFLWEGIEVDRLPAVLAEVAADEFLEVRAVFLWLCDEGIQSPRQSNLRVPD
jgi:MORN repeat variant